MAMVFSCSKPFSELNSLRSLILSMGANLVGFGDVSDGLAREFSHLPYAISMAAAPAGGWGESSPVADHSIYNHQNQRNELLLAAIQNYTLKLLRRQGWKAFAIPANSDEMSSRFIARLYPLFPHKTAATCSGLGWIGKNGLLVTPEYGCQLTWATVLTNAPLDICPTPALSGHCGSCRRCIDACPVGALSGAEWSRAQSGNHLLDAETCRAQLEKNAIEHGIFACGHCILACRKGPKKISNNFYNHAEREVLFDANDQSGKIL